MNITYLTQQYEREKAYKLQQKRREWDKKNPQQTERRVREAERKLDNNFAKKIEKLQREKPTPKKKPKKRTITKEKRIEKEYEKIFSQYVRIRDASIAKSDNVLCFNVRCYSCNGRLQVCWYNPEENCWVWQPTVHNGHMIAKGRSKGIKYDERVCRPQCSYCNISCSHKQDERTEQWRGEVGEEVYNDVMKRKLQGFSYTIMQMEEGIAKMGNYIEKKLKKYQN